MQEGLASLAGLGLLALLLVDVFTTVFMERGGPGPLTGLVYAWWWRGWRGVCRRLPGDHRRLLALAGPLLLPLTIGLWATELVLGFALLYLPAAGSFASPGSSPSPPFVAALYVSGYSASTLGVGDVFPQTAGLRLMTTVEAALGFAVFSVSIAYVLSVYGALRQSKALALEITRLLDLDHRRSGLPVLAAAITHGREDELAHALQAITTRLVQVSEAQQQYPLIEYFHVPDDDRALPVALDGLLQLLTVCRSWLDPGRHPALSAGPGSAFSLRAGSAYVADRGARVRAPDWTTTSRTCTEQDRLAARTALVEAGAHLRPPDDADEGYQDLQRGWWQPLCVLRRHYGYG